MDRIAADRPALLRGVERDRLGVVAHRCLARGIGRRAGDSDEARARGHVDDRAGAPRTRLGLHRAQGIAAAEEAAVGVDAVDTMPFCKAGVLRIVRRGTVLEAGDPGVVDQHVDRGEGRRQRVPFALAGDIEAVEAAAQLVGGFPTFVFVDIGERHLGALRKESAADRLADPACAAGDHADHVVELAHGDRARPLRRRCRCRVR